MMMRFLFGFSKENHSTKVVYLLPLRIYLGLFYLQTGYNKVSKDFGFGWTANMEKQITASLPDVSSWYGYFLEHVVLNSTTLFAVLVSWGEMLLGLSLLLGFAVRLSGALGAFMALNFALLSGREIWLPHFDTTLMLALLTLSLTGAGRVFGIDKLLGKTFNTPK